MIDIIIPNYNGIAHLTTCLDALRRQTRRDFCVVMVDDASTDESCALVRRNYPEVQVIRLPENRGFAAAVNAAFHATGGEYVVLLNNDTEAHPAWLAQLIGALDRYPDYAFAASKLMLFDRRDHIHSAGDFYQANGVPGSRGVWQPDAAQYNVMQEVFGACAGAAAYRRVALEGLLEQGKLFDEDLVMYCEDVDLNLRARLPGLRPLFVRQGLVYHRLSAPGGGKLASYYCGRNFILVWAKNMPGTLIRRSWPAFLRAQLGITLEALWHAREEAARARLRGQLAGLMALPKFLRKRLRQRAAAAPELAETLLS